MPPAPSPEATTPFTILDAAMSAATRAAEKVEATRLAIESAKAAYVAAKAEFRAARAEAVKASADAARTLTVRP
jgi:hypothetical protein